jgi:ABC-type phosphate transport system substrate-binding protein
MRTRVLLLRRATALAVLALALSLGGGRASLAADDGIKIIVHPDNPVPAVDASFVRDAFLKKAASWSDGRAIRPIDLGKRSTARTRFTHDILRKTPAQLRTYWNQRVFSGKGVPPPEAVTTAAVIAFVAANPGAIGYLPSGVDAGGVKVVPLR